MNAFQLPSDAWGTVWIGGAQCEGCIFYKVIRDSVDNNGRDRTRTDCWIEVPACSCCRIYCGSKVIDPCHPGKVFVIGDPRQVDTPDICKAYDLTEECSPCD